MLTQLKLHASKEWKSISNKLIYEEAQSLVTFHNQVMNDVKREDAGNLQRIEVVERQRDLSGSVAKHIFQRGQEMQSEMAAQIQALQQREQQVMAESEAVVQKAILEARSM